MAISPLLATRSFLNIPIVPFQARNLITTGGLNLQLMKWSRIDVVMPNYSKLESYHKNYSMIK
jgi:hypothetical protein